MITTTTSAMKSILLLSIIALSAATPEEWFEGLDPVDYDKEDDNERFGFGSNERIIGGLEADRGEYPYFVEMGGCGGALIAPDIVLFAAHCKSGFLNKQLNIGALTAKTEAEGSKVRFCDEWIQDPLWDDETINYDFALCKLDFPVSIDNSRFNVKFELNFEDNVPEVGDNLTVFGMGTIDSGSQATELRDVNVPYLTNEECNAGNRYGGLVTDQMLCAGFPDVGAKDSCQGDSGGPLVKRTILEDGSILDTHVGVVSWGYGCAKVNYPGVYARTSVRADWIKETMCDTLNSVSDLCEDDDSKFDVGANAELYGETQEITCEDYEQKLVVDFNTDYYGYENAWELRSKDSGSRIKLRRYSLRFSNYQTVVCLQSSKCYEWEVRDSYGDGMCSNRGCGSYTLTLNDDEIVGAGDGDFDSSSIESFCTGSAQIADDSDSESNDSNEVSVSSDFSSDVSESNNSSESIDSIDSNDSNESSDSSDVSDNSDESSDSNNACIDNESLRLSLQLMTDDDPTELSIGAYLLNEVMADVETTIVNFQQGSLTQARGLYVLPDAGEYYCLEINRCYMFTIGDSFGDGLDEVGYYKGFLGNDMIFSGSGDFGDFEEHFFCTGSATLPPSTESPSESPSEIPAEADSGSPTDSPIGDGTFSQVPSSVPTEGPTESPTEAPTEPAPTEAPTETPTETPTEAPTQSPTLAPTESPTEFPTEPAPTEAPTGFPTISPSNFPTAPECMDDPDFRWKGKSKKTCEKHLKEKEGSKKIKKKCNKDYGDGKVSDYCVLTCAEKANLGPCSIHEEKTDTGAKKRRSSSDVQNFGV